MRQWITLVENFVEPLSEIIDIEHNERNEKEFSELVPDDFKQYTNKIEKTGTYNGFDLYTNNVNLAYNGKKLYFVDQKNNLPIGMINYRVVNLPKVGEVYQITLVYIKPEYREKGLASYLYKKLLDEGKIIRSDKSQAPGGRALWKSLARNPKYEVISVGNAMLASLRASGRHSGHDLAQWFGRSIVQDLGGEPKIVYASENYSAKINEKGHAMLLVRYQDAMDWNYTKKVYAKIADPLILKDGAKPEDIERMKKVGFDISGLHNGDDVWRLIDGSLPELLAAVKQAGYDGFVKSVDGEGEAYYVFDENQLMPVEV